MSFTLRIVGDTQVADWSFQNKLAKQTAHYTDCIWGSGPSFGLSFAVVLPYTRSRYPGLDGGSLGLQSRDVADKRLC